MKLKLIADGECAVRHKMQRDTVTACSPCRREAAWLLGFQDFFLSPFTIRALSLLHSCSERQCGQKILPMKFGKRKNDASSISMPVSIGCPVTRQSVMIFAMARRDSPSKARATYGNDFRSRHQI